MNKIERKWIQIHARHLEKRKLRFVTWFDTKFPGKYCWADCVSWAFDWRKFNPFKIDSLDGCKIESEKYPHCCYCGKCVNGKVWRNISHEDREVIRNEEKHD